MEEINGKVYPMWSQFIDRKEEWIGGVLEDMGDQMDRALLGMEPMTTTIKDIMLDPNGDDSAMFVVEGEDFGCGFDVKYGGITAGEEGWITFSGYAGHNWRIKGLEDD